MGKLLVVTPHLRPGGPARRLTLFARACPPGAVEVCVLGGPSPWGRLLAEGGVPVRSLDGEGPFDLRALWRLRRHMGAAGADAVCAWGPGAAWPVLLSGVRPSRLQLVAPLPTGRRPTPALGWLAGRCAGAVAEGAAEAAALRRLGVPEGRLSVVAPGVEVPGAVAPARRPGLPDDAEVMLVVGPVRRAKGQREGVWVLDVLAYLRDRLRLVVAGSGPGVAAVRRFVEVARREDRAHFLGEVADLGPWLARADVVLVPGQAGGRTTLVEAMAAGRPVVATRAGGRDEIVEHGRTGLLAAENDVPDLCRQVTAVLADPARARALGECARDEARRRFPPAEYARALRRALGAA